MHTKAQSHRSIFGTNWNQANAALAILLALLFLIFLFLFMTLTAPLAYGQNYQVLYNFTGGADGSTPSTLIIDRAGNLYGTAQYGGYQGNDCFKTVGCGTVFELSPRGSGRAFTTLYTFHGNDGTSPSPAGLTFGPNNVLYGTAIGGVFSVRPSPIVCLQMPCRWNESVLSTSGPYSRLVFDQLGHIYGTAFSGGIYGQGAVYELVSSHGVWAANVLYNFAGSDGSGPMSGVIFDSLGNLYGTTSAGGAYGTALFFNCNPRAAAGRRRSSTASKAEVTVTGCPPD